MDEKVSTLTSWLHQKQADLDLHYFQNNVQNVEKNYAYRTFIIEYGTKILYGPAFGA